MEYAFAWVAFWLLVYWLWPRGNNTTQKGRK